MNKNPNLTADQAEIVRELDDSVNHFYNMDAFTARDGLHRAFHAVVMDSRLLEEAFPEMAAVLHQEFLNKDYSKSTALKGYDERLFGLLLNLHSFRDAIPNVSHFASIRDELMEYLRDFSEFFENYDSESGTWVGLSEW